MKYNHYYLILINFFLKKIIKKKNSLRILNYHNIPTSKISNFEKQIQFIIKNYDIISPEQLGTKDINKKIKKRVLITFDDGYKSVLNALPVLKKYNIYAIFFIIGDFIQIKNDYEIKNFIANNISPKLYDKNLLNEKNLNKEDIISLVKEGHTIGYHTKSHKNLGIIKNHKYISDQINNEIDLFGDKKFTQQINHFSFPFGSIENINRENYKIIKDKYK